ncbi:unnamed protein product [Durusdinium trenchii]|uniref:Uncharacterized protein n=1 Tax=Durusdinium trenchii TaxID=1381693 RepID=A0ABP0N5S7_9DINO
MADASAPADAGPPSGPSQPLDRIDELSDELIRRVQERRGRLREERQKMTLEFEAERSELQGEVDHPFLQVIFRGTDLKALNRTEPVTHRPSSLDEAKRVQLHTEYSTRLLQADEE